MVPKTRWLSDGILLLIAAIWGLTFVLIQNAIATIPPFSFVALRFSCAALLLLPFLGRQKSVAPATLSRVHLLISGGVLGFFLFLGYALQTFSLLYTTSGKSGFLTGLAVALVPLLAWLKYRYSSGAPGLDWCWSSHQWALFISLCRYKYDQSR